MPDRFVNWIRRFYDSFLRLASLFYESPFPERRHIASELPFTSRALVVSLSLPLSSSLSLGSLRISRSAANQETMILGTLTDLANGDSRGTLGDSR